MGRSLTAVVSGDSTSVRISYSITRHSLETGQLGPQRPEKRKMSKSKTQREKNCPLHSQKNVYIKAENLKKGSPDSLWSAPLASILF